MAKHNIWRVRTNNGDNILVYARDMMELEDLFSRDLIVDYASADVYAIKEAATSG